MMWHTEFGTNRVKNMDYLLTSILLFSVVGIIYQHMMMYIIISIFLTYYIINKMYDKTIGKQLTINNPRTTERLFIGDETVLHFELNNHSIYPLINGQFQYQVGPAIETRDYTQTSKSYYQNVNVPLSVMGKHKAIVELTVVAKQRGATRLTHLTYQFPHLFNFDQVRLKYLPFYHTEFIVYPTPLAVQGLESIYQMIPGDERMNFSPFEDVQSPIGTRDYHYNDPFHRVNWKATAKTGKLQTNIYEHVVDMSYIFIVNIGSKDAINMNQFSDHLEKLLSYTAYLCQETMQKGFNYEIFINSRKLGRVPYLHIPEGEGKIHYSKSLEILARIQQQPLVYPFKQMAYRVGQQLYKPKTIVILGELTSDVGEIIDVWRKQQQTIYHINIPEMGEVPYIKRWARDVIKDAKQTS